MQLYYNLLILVTAYLLGSINTSIIVSKVMIGDDIRNHGSGNAGATNTLRTVGKKGALLVVLGDIFKTVLAVFIAELILKDGKQAIYIAGLGVVLGHNYPIFFKFKGGKGIIVSAVVIVAADPIIGAAVIIISVAVMAITRYVSLGSIVGAVLFLILSLIFHRQSSDFLVFAAILSLLAIYRHNGNILRLIRGTENKLSFNKKI